MILGIDEAGRGPVIGPLVITGVMIDESEEEKLVNMGVKDSKKIAPLKRERMAEVLEDLEHHTVVVSPQEIDAALDSTDINLNWLEALKSIEIIKKLRPDVVLLDCPSTNPDAYKKYIADALKRTGYDKKTELIAEHKADDKYPVVGAASIIAKVTRDLAIKKLHDEYGDFGSGYPSDPKTKDFLAKNWKKHPEIFRKTWASYKNVKKNQKKLFDF